MYAKREKGTVNDQDVFSLYLSTYKRQKLLDVNGNKILVAPDDFSCLA